MTTTTQREMGEKLRTARQSAGLTLAALASKLGVSTEAVRLWEAGAAAPQSNNRQRLAQALGMDPAVLGVAPAALSVPESRMVPDRLFRSLRGFLDDQGDLTSEERRYLYRAASEDGHDPGYRFWVRILAAYRERDMPPAAPESSGVLEDWTGDGGALRRPKKRRQRAAR